MVALKHPLWTKSQHRYVKVVFLTLNFEKTWLEKLLTNISFLNKHISSMQSGFQKPFPNTWNKHNVDKIFSGFSISISIE